jgi:acyl carrier protein
MRLDRPRGQPAQPQSTMSIELIDELRDLLVRSLRLQRDPQTVLADTELFGGELELDSLDAMQLLTAIEKHFAIEITDGDLARYPLSTLGSIAALLEAKGCRSRNFRAG